MKKAGFLMLMLALTACVGTSEPAKFYSLQSEYTAGEALKYRSGLSIGIKDVSIPAYLDKPQIVTQGKSGVELNISELNRWSEPPAEMLQRTLAEDMARLMPKAVVKAQTSVREKFDYTVSVEINKFDGALAGEVELEAWWFVRNRAGQTVWRQHSRFSQESGRGYDNLVRTLSRLTAELAREIAAKIATLP